MSSGKGSDGLCDIPRLYGTRKERHDLATICRDMDNLGTACCSILPSARCPAIACAGWTDVLEEGNWVHEPRGKMMRLDFCLSSMDICRLEADHHAFRDLSVII